KTSRAPRCKFPQRTGGAGGSATSAPSATSATSATSVTSVTAATALPFVATARSVVPDDGSSAPLSVASAAASTLPVTLCARRGFVLAGTICICSGFPAIATNAYKSEHRRAGVQRPGPNPPPYRTLRAPRHLRAFYNIQSQTSE